LERTLSNNQAKKKGIGKFFVFASFKSCDYFGEENACFINSRGLTATINKKSNQNFPTPFFREWCQEDSDVERVLPLKSDQKRT